MKHALIALALLATPASAQVFETSAGPVRVEPMVEGLDHPWSFAFLPDFETTGAMLITERPGALRLYQDGALSNPLDGAPGVAARGQGGLLDVALARDFAKSGEIYLSYAASDGLFSARTEVARARLVRDRAPRLEALKVIFRQQPSKSTTRHFGSRIVVAPDGSLFVTFGERGEGAAAQDLGTHQGKVVRITRDGAPWPGNPFFGRDGALPEIWSYGHRNPQGAALDAAGALWVVEHGARGGDEINRPDPGANYGWPEISYGRHYSGEKIGRGTAAAGMEQPAYYWDPSIAPSGLAIYQGDLFPAWRGDFLVGALKFRLLSRLGMEGGRLREEERLFAGAFGRIRDVREAPDGAIWFATDEDPGAIWRMTPAE
ncbi:PQQ-dependent sugar dehydrogenase [Pikeienuella piscinae]|uniref:PQQ-dependent sugar dehydrogenase n=1 Tax=Pikeienuella piscinae TaxID=2748098 RepID=A0A7L5BYC7_9RHOB|nr:PQQ-dependent sugar dehydrogenase [Pikeienuella piscinae]QIE54894.1 PQQ-dependent sugar dehydrogenase [Pikeienuella piscinae]